MPVTKQADGAWRAQFNEYPGGPRRTKRFAKKADAEAWLKRKLGDLARGEYVDEREGRRTTLAEYADRWVAVQPWRDSTRDRTVSVLRNQIHPSFGERPIGAIRTSEVQAWVARLSVDLAPATVEGAYRLLAAILRAAVSDRLIVRSPADGVRLARRDGEMTVPLTVEQVRAIAAAIVPELEAAVIVAASTGLRQGELFGLTEDRVRWLKRELVIDRQLVTRPKGAPTLGPTKTARSVRVVPVADHVVEVLARHRERFGVGDGGFVFHRAGEPLPRNRAADAFRAAAKVAKVEASGWHALRHHAASVLIHQGLSVTAVAATMGHSPAECLKTYAGWWPNENDTIRAAIARAWAAPALAVGDKSAT